MWGFNNVDGIKELITWLDYKNPDHRKMEKFSSDPQIVDKCIVLQGGSKWNHAQTVEQAKQFYATTMDQEVKDWMKSVR